MPVQARLSAAVAASDPALVAVLVAAAVAGIAAIAAPVRAGEHVPGTDLEPALFSALLTSALDPDIDRLQWVDARQRLGCGPGTEIRVDGRPLDATGYVPDHAFELEWQARGCRPFGDGGPQLDGTVRFFVAREDWGFSARQAVADGARLSDDQGVRWLAAGPVSTPMNAPQSSQGSPGNPPGEAASSPSGAGTTARTGD